MSESRLSARWAGHAGAKRLGVIMIVKNEAGRLPALLADLRALADEVVVVDTGSTDATLEICRAWGVTLVQRSWREDFAWARNQAIEHAAAPYLLWLDADDRLSEASARALAELRDSGLPPSRDVAFQMIVHNLDAAGRPLDSFRQVRIFPNRKGVRYRGAIHESFMDGLRAEGVRVRDFPAEVLHCGYATPEARRAKAERNVRLLRRALREDPSDVHAQLHLAQALAGLEEHAEALRTLDGVVARAERVEGRESLLAELRIVRGTLRRAAGDMQGATEDFGHALRLRPRWGVALALRAEQSALEGDWEAVAAVLESGEELEFSPGAFGNPVRRLEGSVSRLRGRVHLERAMPELAIECLERALVLDPSSPDARLELGQALLERRDYARARELLEPLGSDEAALPRLFELLAAVGLARAGTGDLEGAAGCLSPLVELLDELLPRADDASPAELAAALAAVGQHAAARNLTALHALVFADAV